MTTPQQPDSILEEISGTDQRPLGFEDLDQHFRFKVRAFISRCMPPVFKDLEVNHGLREMRKSGVAPIMFYLEFSVGDQPLAFGSMASTDYKVRLQRHVSQTKESEGGKGGGVTRMLLDMNIDVTAPKGSGDPMNIERVAATGEQAHGGHMRGLHVLTRPVAPPGQRQVLEPPAQLADLRVHSFHEVYPDVEEMSRIPQGFQAQSAGGWQASRGVFGLHNTDINQHVNVHESIFGLEDHLAQALHGAGLPAGEHRVVRAAYLFRKPFFMGQPYGLQGNLWRDGERTLFTGGVHGLEANGEMAEKPSVFTRMEGTLL